MRVPVPAESPFKEGSEVNEQLVAPRGSLTAGMTTTSLSVAAAGVGTYLTIDGFGKGNPSSTGGNTTANTGGNTTGLVEAVGGLTLITLGAVGLILGIPMMAVSHDWRVD